MDQLNQLENEPNNAKVKKKKIDETNNLGSIAGFMFLCMSEVIKRDCSGSKPYKKIIFLSQGILPSSFQHVLT